MQTNNLTGCTVPASRASAIRLQSVLHSRLTGVCGMSVVLLDEPSSIGVDSRLMPQGRGGSYHYSGYALIPGWRRLMHFGVEAGIDKFVLVLVASLALLLAGCGGGSSTPAGPTPEEVAAMEAMQMRAMEQKADLEEAHEALTTALAATLNTQDALDAANAAHKTLSDAITAAADVSAADKAKYENAASAAMDRIADAQKIFNAAEAERMAMEQEQQRMEEAAAAAEMAATAAKLYAGISAPMGDATSPATTDRAADYNADNSAIIVTIGDGTNVPTAVTLMEDEDATVAAQHGWEGMMFTASPDGDGTYEAAVYSHVGEPTQGKKFGGTAAEVTANEVEYELTNGGAVAVDTNQDGVPARVALTGVTRTAGTETFNLPDPNPGGATIINVPGSFHGVSGTYNCTPSTPANGCSADVAASGFTLQDGAWTFTPNDPNTRLMETPDDMYASYGWWLHKSEDGETFTASAFAANRGTVAAASGITALMGKATYSGGAAGKYALHSSTGGTNDAGHFTADATLEANFTDDSITGTIDNFVGVDGEARNWSVGLMSSTVSDTGAIAGDPDTDGNTDAQMTQWSMDGTDGVADGQWGGTLYENGDDDVPTIGTGTFHSTFGRDGMMVGAFGVNVDD